MSISNASLPFTESLIAAAPEATGVFALWSSGGIVYYGKASAGAATIRNALAGHYLGRALSNQRVTGCSWEVAADPERRYDELLKDYAAAHHCMPLWNDPQRLPTD